MILSEFTYKQVSGWRLEELSLNHQNLIVGLNSVGKSRTVSALGQVARIIRGETDANMDDIECSLILENGNRLEYSFEIKGGEIHSEILSNFQASDIMHILDLDIEKKILESEQASDSGAS